MKVIFDFRRVQQLVPSLLTVWGGPDFLMMLGWWRGEPQLINIIIIITNFYHLTFIWSCISSTSWWCLGGGEVAPAFIMMTIFSHLIIAYSFMIIWVIKSWLGGGLPVRMQRSNRVWMRQKTEFECVKNLCRFFPDSSHMIINLVAYFAWVLKKLSQLKRYFMTIQVCLSTGGRKAESSSGTGRGKKVVSKMSRH